MRTRLLLALLTLVILVAVAPAIIADKPASPASDEVNVVLDSRPDNAEIQLDGKFIGTTPVNYRLTPGVHRLEIIRGRYNAWARDLSVNAGNPTHVTALLQETAQQPCK